MRFRQIKTKEGDILKITLEVGPIWLNSRFKPKIFPSNDSKPKRFWAAQERVKRENQEQSREGGRVTAVQRGGVVAGAEQRRDSDSKMD